MREENELGGQTLRVKPLTFIEQARRRQILDATAEVVAKLGYARTSLAQIAQHAGISKGVVTYHFTSKDEILDQLVQDYYQRGWEFMEKRILAADTATEKVQAWISSQAEFYATERAGFIAISEIMANHRNADGSHQYASDLAEEVEGLTEILAAGQASGEIRSFEPHSPSSMANIILRSLDGVLVSWASEPGQDLMAEMAALIDFIGHAIRKAPS